MFFVLAPRRLMSSRRWCGFCYVRLGLKVLDSYWFVRGASIPSILYEGDTVIHMSHTIQFNFLLETTQEKPIINIQSSENLLL